MAVYRVAILENKPLSVVLATSYEYERPPVALYNRYIAIQPYADKVRGIYAQIQVKRGPNCYWSDITREALDNVFCPAKIPYSDGIPESRMSGSRAPGEWW